MDVGIKKLCSLSNGEVIANPRFYAKQSKKRNRLNRAASRKKLGSKKRRKAYERIARLEQKVANQRADYQWNIAHKLVNEFDLIVFEELNIKGMMKRCKPKQDENGKYLDNGQSRKAGLNKAIADASWYSLKEKVRVLAARYGVLVHDVNPRHTSQECSQCGFISPTNRDKEKFLCESCGYHADADIQASVNILNKGLKELGISLEVRGDTSELTPKDSVVEQRLLTQVVEPGNESEKEFVPIQLSLFDLMGFMPESSSKS